MNIATFNELKNGERITVISDGDCKLMIGRDQGGEIWFAVNSGRRDTIQIEMEGSKIKSIRSFDGTDLKSKVK